jgi:ectoine hydroxylase-related dioxygenase (phytanoyl-CoA dioxygenase family)
MTFLPGTHRRTDLASQNLGDARSLFALAPDLEWSERVTVPLRAGDCTFHHGRCAHMATPNETEEDRVAHVVIFFEADATYKKQPHIVTDPLGLHEGAPFEHELFPRVG